MNASGTDTHALLEIHDEIVEHTRVCWETLGRIRERLIELQNYAADIDDDQLSRLVARALVANGAGMRPARAVTGGS